GSFEQPAGSDWTTFRHTFTQAGEFPYFCSIHGGPGGVGMAGKVIVQSAATATPTVTPTVTPTATVTPSVTPTPTGTSASHEVFLPAVEK
ncbi:MAG: endonuclease, partial [Gammaproteobacteria bacterium]